MTTIFIDIMTMILIDPPSLAHLMTWTAWILLHAIWQGTCIAGLLWLALKVFGPNASSMRYGSACVAMFTIAIAPPVTGILLRDRLRTLPPVRSATWTTTWMIDHQATWDSDTMTRPSAITPQQNNLSTALSAFRENLATTFHRFQRLIDSYAIVMVWGWLLGVAISTIRLLSSFRAVRILRRSGSAVTDPAVLEKFARLIQQLNLAPDIRLLQSAAVHVPTVIGWFRPMILFPVALLSGFSLDQVEALLAHELAHIKRYDYLVNVLQTVIEIVLFYHPAVWWISSTMRHEREHCCDAIALRLSCDRELYATTLFELARLAVTPTRLSLSAGGGSLKERIYRILEAGTQPSNTAGPVLAFTASILVMFMLAAFCLPKADADDLKINTPKSEKIDTETDQPSTNGADTSSANENNQPPSLDKSHRFAFVLAQHTLWHDGKIVTWEEIERILDVAAAKHQKIYPIFKMTNGRAAIENGRIPDRVNVLYARLYESKHIDGMTSGICSPRASERYDRVRDAADLSDASTFTGTIVSPDDRPLEGVEVFLLPFSIQGIWVHLQNGRLRETVEEHCVRTDDSGKFVTSPEPSELFICATHPQGFFITTLKDLETGDTLKLQPWARVHGKIDNDDVQKQNISFTSYPVFNVSFNIWETVVADDGAFDERFLPPGKIMVQRSLNSESGGSNFSVKELNLPAGESAEFHLGPIPEQQKKAAEEWANRNRR